MPTWTHSTISVSPLVLLPRPVCDAGPLAALAGQMWHVGRPGVIAAPQRVGADCTCCLSCSCLLQPTK